LKGRDLSEDLVERGWVDDIWRTRVGNFGLNSSGSGYGPVTGSREHSNESSGSIKGGITSLTYRPLASQEGFCIM